MDHRPHGPDHRLDHPPDSGAGEVAAVREDYSTPQGRDPLFEWFSSVTAPAPNAQSRAGFAPVDDRRPTNQTTDGSTDRTTDRTANRTTGPYHRPDHRPDHRLGPLTGPPQHHRNPSATLQHHRSTRPCERLARQMSKHLKPAGHCMEYGAGRVWTGPQTARTGPRLQHRPAHKPDHRIADRITDDRTTDRTTGPSTGQTGTTAPTGQQTGPSTRPRPPTRPPTKSLTSSPTRSMTERTIDWNYCLDHRNTTAPPPQQHCNTATAPQQHRNSTATAPQQHRNSAATAPQHRSVRNPESTARAVTDWLFSIVILDPKLTAAIGEHKNASPLAD